MDANQMDPVLRNAIISTRAGVVSHVESCPVTVRGNAVTLSALVVNVSASSTVTFYLEGSYDGMMWFSITNFTQNSFGYNSATQGSLNYTFIRVRVTIAGTNVEALFHASLSWAQPT